MAVIDDIDFGPTQGNAPPSPPATAAPGPTAPLPAAASAAGGFDAGGPTATFEGRNYTRTGDTYTLDPGQPTGTGAAPTGGQVIDDIDFGPAPISQPQFAQRFNEGGGAASPELQTGLERRAINETQPSIFGPGGAIETGNWRPIGERLTGDVSSALSMATAGHQKEMAGLIGAIVSSASGGDWSTGYAEGYHNAKAYEDTLGNKFERLQPTENVLAGAAGFGITAPLTAGKAVTLGPRIVEKGGELVTKLPGVVERAGARLLNAAPAGVAFGAAAGAGDIAPAGDQGSRSWGDILEAMRKGGNLGAAVGAAGEALPGILAGGGKALKWGAEKLPVAGQLVQGAENLWRLATPGRQAEKMLGETLQATPAGAEGVADTMRTAQAYGVPTTVGAAGGTEAGIVARRASNADEKAAAILREATQPAVSGQAGRIEDFLKGLRGSQYADNPEFEQAIHDRSRAILEPEYQAAREATPNGVISPRLTDLTNKLKGLPEMERILEEAHIAAELDATAGRGLGSAIRTAGGHPIAPTIDYWDQLQRSLRGRADKYYRANDPAKAATIREFRRQINEEVDNLVPEFARARGIAFHFKGAENALDVGASAVHDTNFGERQAEIAMRSASSPEEAQLLREGFINEKIKQMTLERQGGAVADPGRLFHNAREERVARIFLGERDFRTMKIMQIAEQGLNHFNRAINAQSTTAAQLWKRLGPGLVGGGLAGFIGGDRDPVSLSTHAFMGVAVRYGGGVLKDKVETRMFIKLAEMFASKDPATVEAAARRVASSPRMTELFRRFANGAQQLYGAANSGKEGGQ